jgi:hypothetical protein
MKHPEIRTYPRPLPEGRGAGFNVVFGGARRQKPQNKQVSPPEGRGRGRAVFLLDLALLLGVAAFLGWWGGTPFYHPDTILEKALRTLAQGGNPHFFNYPALMLYLNGAAFQGWFGLLQAAGQVPAGATPLDWYLAVIQPGAGAGLPVFAPGHLVNLAFSLLGVACTYLAAYCLARSRAAAQAAGLLLATCLLWASDAHFITVDTALAALGMATVALALHFTGPHDVRPRPAAEVVKNKLDDQERKAEMEQYYRFMGGRQPKTGWPARAPAEQVCRPTEALAASEPGAAETLSVASEPGAAETPPAASEPGPAAEAPAPERRPLFWWQLLVLAVLAGLTAAAKYNGALVLLSVAAFSYGNYRSKERWAYTMLGVCLLAFAVFLAANPFIVQDTNRFAADFQYEMDHTRRGHPGFSTDAAWLFHLGTSLPAAYGWLALGLAAGGAAWLALTRRLSGSAKWGLGLYPLAGFLVIGGSRLAFQRYTIPLLPFIAILAALGLAALVGRLRRSIPRLPRQASGGLALALLLAAALPNLRNVVQSDWLLTQVDTRAYFVRVMLDSGLALTSRPGFAGQYTDLFFGYRYKGGQSEANRAEILVMDSFSHDRWLYDATTPLRVERARFAGGAAIQITPFSLPKEQVPVSPQSIYSPYLPDLYLRAAPGPFIEVYLPDDGLAQAVMDSCVKYGAPCTRLPAAQGYYYQQVMR